MNTPAQEKIERAKERIDEASKGLLGLVQEESPGFEDFKDSYVEDLITVAFELLKLKRLL